MMRSKTLARLPPLALLLAAAIALLPHRYVAANTSDIEPTIRNEALNSDTGYDLLTTLCDQYGGRPAGSRQNLAAMDRLATELQALGLEPRYEYFTMPTWVRGDDTVELLAPFSRRLRVCAIGSVNRQPTFEADVVDLGDATAEQIKSVEKTGAIGLIDFRTAVSKSELYALGERAGLRGVLQINREGGGQLLARAGGMDGAPLPFPFFSITREEGLWIRRMLAAGEQVRVRMAVRSQSESKSVANLSVRFPGRSESKVVLGGHFDSWDLGQGAMDNGLGIAQLFETARLLAKFSPQNHHIVEVVWFNGEELGLWGSRARAPLDATDGAIAMINLDMVGWPKAVNAMGHDDLVPFLKAFRRSLPENFLPEGVINEAWMASDHTPYAIAGVRTVSFNAPIPRESVRYYHDFADTLDKADPAMLKEATAVVASLVVTLANTPDLPTNRLTPQEVAEIFDAAGITERLKDSGLWSPPTSHE